MVDIRLISILPAQGIQQPQQVTTGSGSGAPTILANIPTGSILAGFIVNRDPAGNPVLRSENGDIAFETNFFLKIGSEVVIRVENRAGNALARILTVNGQAPEIAETQSGFASDPDVIIGQRGAGETAQAAKIQQPGAQPQAATSASLQAVQIRTQGGEPVVVVTGTVLSPPPGKSTAPQLPEGAQLSLKIVSLMVPGKAAPAAGNTPAPSAQQPVVSPSLYAAYAKTDAAPAASPVLPATPQTPAPAVIQTPPTAPATPAAPLPAFPSNPVPIQQGQIIAATVIGNESGGETLVQTPVGIVRLQPGIVQPVGTKVTFEVGPVTLPQTGAAAAAESIAAPVVTLSGGWTTLQQISSLLTADDGLLSMGGASLASLPWMLAGGGSQQMQATITPQTITAGMMLFISALRSGDFRNWLGKDAVQWLEDKGHGALVRKAEGEFTGLARAWTDPQPGQWQSLVFPLAVSGEWHPVRLFVKRDRRESNQAGAERREDDTRFVVEVTLSQMGELQMDGMVRRRPDSMEFDLFIRSLKPLSGQIQQDILKIYDQSGQIAGYRGQLVFQAVKTFPVNPLEDIASQETRNLLA